MRYRMTFEKAGTARFVGHLDLQTLFQRAFKRAGLPVAFSKGFNPHQLVSFAMPLALGMAGLMEVVEAELAEAVDCAGMTAAVNRALPAGLCITGNRALGGGERAAASLVCAAVYEVGFPDGLAAYEALSRLMAREYIMMEKRTKRGAANADIKPDILGFEYVGGLLVLRLSAGGERNLKPDLAARAVLDELGAADAAGALRYARRHLLTAEGICR